jgi:hypothetical protein
MSISQHDSGPTSNDLLESLVAEHAPAALTHQMVSQSAEEVRNLDNAPAVSMGPHLLESVPRT